MSNQLFERREFLRIMGIGAAGLSAGGGEVFKEKDDSLTISDDDSSDFTVEVLEGANYEYDATVLKQMSEKYNVFSRNIWDPERRRVMGRGLSYEHLVKGRGRIPDQTRLDYALSSGAWRFANSRTGAYDWGEKYRYRYDSKPWEPSDIGMTWKDASRVVKHAAKFYGASLVGIAKLNPLWLYSDHYAPRRTDMERTIPVIRKGERFERGEDRWFIPESMNRVIVVAFEEDYYGIANSPGRLATAATGNGYSRMAFTAGSIAEFIRFLGYRAIPAGNNVGLSIPMAIDAGLGELGRNGLLVTPRFGPRVRIAKVITDMPLVTDSPIRFGVKEFCEVCKLCADHCPSGSITDGPQTWRGKSISNNHGTLKWYIKPESCYDYNGFSCSNCKRVCPFSKPNNSWLHRMIRGVIQGKITLLDKIMVTFDQASGYGRKISDSEFWNSDGSRCITSREPK